MDEEQLAEPDWYVEHCRPKLGRDFILTARGLLTEELRAEMEMLRDFSFSNHPKYPISETRLELLGRLVRQQVARILE